MKSVTCTWRASCGRPVACQRTLCEPSENIDDHYDLDFDKSSKSTRGISFLLYSKDANDFSSKMITRLNDKSSE